MLRAWSPWCLGGDAACLACSRGGSSRGIGKGDHPQKYAERHRSSCCSAVRRGTDRAVFFCAFRWMYSVIVRVARAGSPRWLIPAANNFRGTRATRRGQDWDRSPSGRRLCGHQLRSPETTPVPGTACSSSATSSGKCDPLRADDQDSGTPEQEARRERPEARKRSPIAFVEVNESQVRPRAIDGARKKASAAGPTPELVRCCGSRETIFCRDRVPLRSFSPRSPTALGHGSVAAACGPPWPRSGGYARG